jgi:hypothetical protein
MVEDVSMRDAMFRLFRDAGFWSSGRDRAVLMFIPWQPDARGARTASVFPGNPPGPTATGLDAALMASYVPSPVIAFTPLRSMRKSFWNPHEMQAELSG